MSRGLALSIAAGERPTSDEALQVQRLRPRQQHRGAHQRQRIWESVTFAAASFVVFQFHHHCFVRLGVRVLEFLVVRLGRGTLTRGPLDAATLRLLMTFLPLWLPCDGLRI
jgi:hypothetical protein